jgi:hypothetical protein
MTGPMSAQGFTTGVLAVTVWSKEVSASMPECAYVSMPNGGTGNGSISHLLGPVCTGDTPKSPKQISSTDAVSQPLSDTATRQRASRKRKLENMTASAVVKKMKKLQNLKTWLQ